MIDGDQGQAPAEQRAYGDGASDPPQWRSPHSIPRTHCIAHCCGLKADWRGTKLQVRCHAPVHTYAIRTVTIGFLGAKQQVPHMLSGAYEGLPPTRAIVPNNKEELNRTFAEVRASRNTIETVSLSRRNNFHANVCAPVELAPSRQATNGQRRYSCRALRSRYKL
jgi:hypothetical protein